MPGDSASVGTMVGVVPNAHETAEASSVSACLLENFQTLLRVTDESGKGLEDISAMTQMLRRDAHRV